MSMRQRRGLNEQQREALRELDARASHDTGWFTFQHAGGDVFALPHPTPDNAGGEIYLPAGTIEALDQGKSIRNEYPYAVQAFALGDQLTLVALSGEVVVDYAIRLAAIAVSGVLVSVSGFVLRIRGEPEERELTLARAKIGELMMRLEPAEDLIEKS